jgi:hypothetical protein
LREPARLIQAADFSRDSSDAPRIVVNARTFSALPQGHGAMPARWPILFSVAPATVVGSSQECRPGEFGSHNSNSEKLSFIPEQIAQNTTLYS